MADSIAISQDGIVICKTRASDEIQTIGQITMNRFINPAGLTSVGGNLFKVSEASGAEINGIPAFEGMGKIHQGFIEMSNVQVVEEMVNMIVAQRAYDLNSKTIQTSDAMLNTVVNLKR